MSNVVSPPLNPSSWRHSARQRLLLLGILGVLHVVLLLGAESAIGRSLLIVQFGLFLLWQPFIRSRSILPWRHLVLFALLLMGFVWIGWWSLLFWLMLLGGVIGGRVFFRAGHALRVFHLLALADLMVMLLLVVVPTVIPQASLNDANIVRFARYLVPAILGLMMLLLPIELDRHTEAEAETIDLIYSLLVVLLLAVIVFGSVSLMLLRTQSYIQSLIDCTFAIGFMLLAFALVWSPRAGFAGLAAMLSRYLLAESLPFEKVLRDFTDLARVEDSPNRFVDEACRLSLNYLSWVNGIRWQLEYPERKTDSQGELGELIGVENRFALAGFRLTFFTESQPGPTLLWQAKLLTQLLAEFAVAKVQAERLKQMSYLQAVHETGARLTHDVKNLLQSLNTLVAASAHAEASQSADFQALLRRQLPVITQRLQQTMNKLQKPERDTGQFMVAKAWWENLQRRYEGSQVQMKADAAVLGLVLPLSLFDSAAENFLQNAFDKRALQPSLNINLRLLVRDDQAVLEVRDDGTAVPAELIEQLGVDLIKSENGLGVGLYQLARQAEAARYEISLTENLNGAVSFRLRPMAA